MDIAVLLDWINRGNAPMLAALCYFVYRIYTNHLPHIDAKLDEHGERISRLEGESEGRGER